MMNLSQLVNAYLSVHCGCVFLCDLLSITWEDDPAVDSAATEAYAAMARLREALSKHDLLDPKSRNMLDVLAIVAASKNKDTTTGSASSDRPLEEAELPWDVER